MLKRIKLHIALRSVVEQFGSQIIASDRLFNLLLDFLAFSEYPYTKPIVSDMLSKGFGQQIYTTFCSNPSSLTTFVSSMHLSYCKEASFAQDQVRYVLDSFLYALSVAHTIAEPTSKVYKSYSPEDFSSQALENQYSMLSEQYIDSLAKLAIKPTNIFNDPAGYYTAESLNLLYGLEAKIMVLQFVLGKGEDNWCKERLDACREKMQLEKRNAIDAEIKLNMHNYSLLLTDSIVVPSFLFIRFPAFVKRSKQPELQAIEDRIRSLCQERGETYNDWCKQQKEDLLFSYRQRAKSRFKTLARLSAIVCVVYFIILHFCNIMNSLDEKRAFFATMSYADSLRISHDYVAAFDAYYSADTAYTGDYFPSYYHNKAKDAFVATIPEFRHHCDSLVQKKKYKKVKTIIDAIPTIYSEEYPDLQNCLDKYKQNDKIF